MARQRSKTSGRHLAALLGISQATVRDYIADPRFPYPNGPWSKKQIAEIRNWRANYLQENRNADSDANADRSGSLDLARAHKQVSIQLMVERRAKLIAERKIIEKVFIAREENERATAQKFGAIKKALQQMARALSQPLADESDPIGTREILEKAFRALCNSISNKIWDDQITQGEQVLPENPNEQVEN